MKSEKAVDIIEQFSNLLDVVFIYKRVQFYYYDSWKNDEITFAFIETKIHFFL